MILHGLVVVELNTFRRHWTRTRCLGRGSPGRKYPTCLAGSTTGRAGRWGGGAETPRQSTRRTRESVDSVVTCGVEPLRLDGESVSEVIVVSIVLHVVKYPEQHLKQIFPPMSFKLISISIQYLKYTQNSVYVKITSWQHQRAQYRKVQKRCGTETWN